MSKMRGNRGKMDRSLNTDHNGLDTALIIKQVVDNQAHHANSCSTLADHKQNQQLYLLSNNPVITLQVVMTARTPRFHPLFGYSRPL